MLTIVQQPDAHTGAFGRNKLTVTTDDTSVKYIKIELYVSGVLSGVQLLPVFNATVMTDLRNLYSAILFRHNNIILDVTSTQTLLNRVSVARHSIQVGHRILEDQSGGHEVVFNKQVYKSVTVPSLSVTTLPLIPNKKGKKVRQAFKGQKIPVSVYTNNTDNKVVLLNNVNVGSFLGPIRFRQGWFTDPGTKTVNELKIQGATTEPVTYITDQNCTERSVVLYWLNEFGGWEWYAFNDSRSALKSNKTNYTVYGQDGIDTEILQYVGGTILEKRLYGRPVNADSVGYLRSLIQASIVFDEQGERVRVLDTNLVYDDEGLFEPEITIEYLEQKTITF